MLFGRRKEEFLEKIMERLEGILEQKVSRKLEEALDLYGKEFDSLRQEAGAVREEVRSNSAKNEILIQNMSRFQTELHKHDMSIEDLLEEWDEKSSDEKENGRRMQEYEHSEKALLNLFEAYQEQFFRLKRFAGARDGAWSEQISLMEKNLERCRQQCGIGLIEEDGVPVNYDLHEVIEVKGTDDIGQDNLIAEVFRCGYIYKGRIVKKAQVAAYRGGGLAEDDVRTKAASQE